MRNLKKGDYVISSDYHINDGITLFGKHKLLEDYEPGQPFYVTHDWNNVKNKFPVEWFITLEEHRKNILDRIAKGGWNKGNMVIYMPKCKPNVSEKELTIGEYYYLSEDYDYGLDNDRPSVTINLTNNLGHSTHYYKTHFITQIEYREHIIKEIIND